MAEDPLEKIQQEIASHLGLSQENLVFSFKQKEGITQLDLITFNPLHNQSFLFHTTKAIDKLEALMKLREYILHNYQKEDSFTLQWIKIGEDRLHTSYFRAKNIYEVLDKFFYDRDMNSYRIYSISLNPIS